MKRGDGSSFLVRLVAQLIHFIILPKRVLVTWTWNPRSLTAFYDLSTMILVILCFVAGPIDGQWSFWSAWSSCPQTCGLPGGSIIRRTRQCNVPPPMNGGKACLGNDTETLRSCFRPCPGKELTTVLSFYFILNSLGQVCSKAGHGINENSSSNLSFSVLRKG